MMRATSKNLPHNSRSARPAFTLIELMVAMTLSLFVMLILTQAFVTSLDSFEGLKGLGDMEAHLRTVAISLRTDLSQNHFEGKRRMSDPEFWNLPLKSGFFHVRQSGASQLEGKDTDDIPSYATFKTGASYHMIAFTNRLVGNQPEKVYAASLPAGSPLDGSKRTNFFGQPSDALYQQGNRFNSQWASVAYFLVQTGSTVEFDNPSSTSGTPLHALYRSEYLLVPDNTEVNPPNTVTPFATPLWLDHQNVSMQDPTSNGGNILFNSPATVQVEGNRDLDTSALVPRRRGDASIVPARTERWPTGATLLMTNVVAFNVRAQRYLEAPYNQLESDFSDLHVNASGQRVFDTASPQFVPKSDPIFSAAPPTSDVRYRIHALEITIRIWDQKTEQARQITVIQSL